MVASVPNGINPELRDIGVKFHARQEGLHDGACFAEILPVANGALNKGFVPVLQAGEVEVNFLSTLGASHGERAMGSAGEVPVKGDG